MVVNSVEDSEFSIELKVKKSALSSIGSGIGRINSSYLEGINKDEFKMVSLERGKKKIAVKLVSDKLADEGCIILREGDMDSLKANEGDLVEITPFKTLGEDFKMTWEKFINKFKKDEKEEEEGG